MIVGKPLLLLDVDGVILFQEHRKGRKETPLGWIDTRMIRELEILDLQFTIIWNTGWGHLARTEIAPLFNMPDYPVLDIVLDRDFKFAYMQAAMALGEGKEALEALPGNWKLSSVERFLEDYDTIHPVAWLDDEIGQTDVKRWAQMRPNTMLVHVNSHSGVSKDDLSRLYEFGYLQAERPTQ